MLMEKSKICHVPKRRRSASNLLGLGFVTQFSSFDSVLFRTGYNSSCYHVLRYSTSYDHHPTLRPTKPTDKSYVAQEWINSFSHGNMQQERSSKRLSPSNNLCRHSIQRFDEQFTSKAWNYKQCPFLAGDNQGSSRYFTFRSESIPNVKYIHLSANTNSQSISSSSSSNKVVAAQSDVRKTTERVGVPKRRRSRAPPSVETGEQETGNIPDNELEKKQKKVYSAKYKESKQIFYRKKSDKGRKEFPSKLTNERKNIVGSRSNNQTRKMAIGSNISSEKGFMYHLMYGKPQERKRVLDYIRNSYKDLQIEDIDDMFLALVKQRRMKEAISVIKLFEEEPLAHIIRKAKSVKTYTIMIDIYGRSFQLSRAFSLFYGMMRDGLKPSIITYNTMITACSRNNEPELAYEIFEELQESGLQADKFTYGSLIDACAKCGQVERAFEISNMMDKSKVRKDQTIYSALLDACGRTKQLDRAFTVFEEMKRNSVWPNLITFAVLIDNCANAREPEQAFRLFSEIKHWGIAKANVVVYTSLIDACGKAGWPERAEIVMTRMLNDDIRPNEVTFGALIDAWAKGGHLDKAFQVLDRMNDKYGVRPNEILVSSLVDSCRRLGDQSRIKKLWQTMIRYNIRPSRTLYPTLISMATNYGDLDVATAITLHAYARGLFRKVSLRGEQSTLRAQACALIYLRHRLIRNEGNRAAQCPDLIGRLGVVFNSLSITPKEMDELSPAEAYNFCVQWGSYDQEDGMQTFRQKGGMLKDKNGIYRKDSEKSAAARRAKENASKLKQAI